MKFQGCVQSVRLDDDNAVKATVKTKPKRKPKYKISDLPQWVGRDKWEHVVVPTLLSFYGNVRDPWKPDLGNFQRALQYIVNEVYHDVDVDKTIHRSGAIFAVVKSLYLSSDGY